MINQISISNVKYFVIALLVLQSACAAQSPVNNRELSKSYSGELENILVLSVGEDRNQSLNFENLITARIRNTNTQAVAATSKLGTSTPPGENLVIKIAQEIDADAVLVLRLKSIDTTRTVKTPQTVTTMRSGGINLNGYHPYDFWETTEPERISNEATVTITAELYLMRDGTRVWSIDSTSFRRDRINQIIHENADAIVNQLIADNLIIKK